MTVPARHRLLELVHRAVLHAHEQTAARPLRRRPAQVGDRRRHAHEADRRPLVAGVGEEEEGVVAAAGDQE